MVEMKEKGVMVIKKQTGASIRGKGGTDRRKVYQSASPSEEGSERCYIQECLAG